MYLCDGILFSPQSAVNPDTGYSVEGREDNGGKKTRAAGLHLYEAPGAVRSMETESRGGARGCKCGDGGISSGDSLGFSR